MLSSKIIKFAPLDKTDVMVRGNRTEPLSTASRADCAEDISIDLERLRAAVLSEAAGEAEAIRLAAREQGYQQGLAEARQQAAESLIRLQAVASSAVAEQMAWARAAEHDLVDLAMLIAERVTQAELRVNPDLVFQAVRSGLDVLEQGVLAQVHVHPKDAELLEEHWNEVFPDRPLSPHILVPDASLERGSCVLESGQRRIVRQRSAILAAIDQVFKEHWGELS